MSTEQHVSEPIFRHGYAQVGDVRLHYAESGAGERLVVLLHGFPECWYSWRWQLPVLGQHFRVVALDMRGYNLSDKPGSVADYRMERLVDDVLGLIRHCGARAAALVGHDWGAAIAWAVAERHPEYIWKLAALQVPPTPVWRANQTWRQALRSWYMLFFQLPRVPEWWLSANDFAQVAAMFKATARRGTFTETDIAVFKTALKQRGARDVTSALTGALNYYRANFFRLFRAADNWMPAQGGRVRVPTLFLYGERDRFIVPETVRGVGAYVAAPYREVRFAHANHWLQQEAPMQVNAALLNFLLNDDTGGGPTADASTNVQVAEPAPTGTRKRAGLALLKCGHCGTDNTVASCPRCDRSYVITTAHIEGRLRDDAAGAVNHLRAVLLSQCDFCIAEFMSQHGLAGVPTPAEAEQQQRTCPVCHAEFLSQHGM